MTWELPCHGGCNDQVSLPRFDVVETSVVSSDEQIINEIAWFANS